MSKRDELKIAYEPHPVTSERKAELRKQGYRIIDARFKPAEALASAPSAPTQPPAPLAPPPAAPVKAPLGLPNKGKA